MFTLSQRQTFSISHYLDQTFNPTQEFTNINKNNFITIQTVTKQICFISIMLSKATPELYWHLDACAGAAPYTFISLLPHF